MVDFAGNVHFRTASDSKAKKEGFRGGYGWFFGRFADPETFTEVLKDHLIELGYEFFEFEMLLEISSASDLLEGEQQELYRRLADHPLQYHTIHLYRSDDG